VEYRSVARIINHSNPKQALESSLRDEIDTRVDLLIENKGLTHEDMQIVFSPMKEVHGVFEMTAVIITNEQTSLSPEVPVSNELEPVEALPDVLAREVRVQESDQG
jgi:hypothetical protein